MTLEDATKIAGLVDKIDIEKDRVKFIELVLELNDVLEAKDRRLSGNYPATP